MHKPSFLLPARESRGSIGHFVLYLLCYGFPCEVVVSKTVSIVELCAELLMSEPTAYTPRADRLVEISLSVHRANINVVSRLDAADAPNVACFDAAR